MNQLVKAFNRRVAEKEAVAVAGLANMAIQIDMYSSNLNSLEQKYVNQVIEQCTNTLSNIRIIRVLPISFN